ncbi:hypothetical protein ACQ4PT_063848 [Festuca glaucescens]
MLLIWEEGMRECQSSAWERNGREEAQAEQGEEERGCKSGELEKHSKTPKSRQKNSNSKFKRMKERLQYKNVSQDVQEEPIPLQTVPPSDEPPFDEPEHPLHDEEKPEEVANVVEKKNNLFNRSSPMKIVRVCKGMTSKQCALIRGADFTAILNMKCSKLIPELCRFLMEHFDPVACVLDFGERGKIPVDVQSVVNVMAVPMGTHPVPYKQNIDATCSVLEMMEINNGRQPTLSEVEKQLDRSYPADDAYLRKFIIFLISSVFAPTTGIYKLVQYREAVINMCSAFEDGLSQFIRSFAPNQVKEGNPDLHQAEEEVENTSKHKRRRRVTKVQHSDRDDGNQKHMQVDQMEGEANPRANEAKSKKRKPDDRFIAVGRPKKKKMKVTVVSEDCHD